MPSTLGPVRGFIRFLLWVCILGGITIGALRAIAIRWVRLPVDDIWFETSLYPTLAGGDLILLWRIGEPQFGDLVLCPEPDYPERIIIGRILGLPGDDVKIHDGEPSVNNEKFIWERTCDPTYFDYAHPGNPTLEVHQQCEFEAMANHLHMVGITAGHKVQPEDRQYKVPDGQYFLISDNRLFPYDSRDYGFVPIETCQEMVVARLVSKEGWGDTKKRLDYIR